MKRIFAIEWPKELDEKVSMLMKEVGLPKTKSRMLFVDDLPGRGGYRVACESCKHEQDTKYAEPFNCAKCGIMLYYPDGASW